MRKDRNNDRRKEERRRRLSLTLMFSAIVFVILVLSVVIAGVVVYVLARFGVFDMSVEGYPAVGLMILFMALISILLGSCIALVASRLSMWPITRLVNQMNRLASGDFQARLSFGRAVSAISIFEEISEGFNKMAEELENTEMLRSDFINNFSHEFKTPIVSIAGFAKLLKRDNISEELKAEYVNIIEEESLRLSYMATNVLNLTKIENQSILTDVTEFNLSEQLRSSALLLESKWSRKNIDFNMDFAEHTIRASEELLKQVWINLLDNAVKYSPENSVVDVVVRSDESSLNVTVANSGSEISPENLKKIFIKFYQADESHSSEGNGVGLAIVKKITELHGGTVTAESKNGKNAFTVKLPK